MDKLKFARLLDAYSGLLTPTQREIADLYFNLDLSLSEIAEDKGISRQAVSDCLSACRRQLEEYEDVLRLSSGDSSERLDKIKSAVKNWAEKLIIAHPDFSAEAEELLKIIED